MDPLIQRRYPVQPSSAIDTKGKNVNKLLIAGAFMVLSATATAGETGTINQAGPYETTMRFYLHPAHGFPGKAENPSEQAAASEQGAPAAGVTEKPRALASRDSNWRRPATRQASVEPAVVRTDETPPRSLR